MSGQSVTVAGIVTGDFQDTDADTTNNLGGFYIQQEVPDADPASSEGVFVFDGGSPAIDVSVGDLVEVNGTVSEHFGETQITASAVRIVGDGVIPATDVTLPSNGVALNSDGDPIADLERFEGMLIRFPQKLSVSNLRFLEQFGAVGLSQGGRLFQFTNRFAPNSSAYAAYKSAAAARSIVLDDGMRVANPSTIRHLNAGAVPGYSIRAGDSISGISGNLRYSRGSGGRGDEAWRLMPVGDPSFDASNPRPGAPRIDGEVRIASFNVLNFFSTIDNGRPDCGPQGDDNCRGADSPQELSRQLTKTVSALAMMNADVIGLIELENNASASIAVIVDALNEHIGSSDYAFLDTGSINDDAIKTAFVYRTTTVRLSGSFALLDSSVDARFDDDRNRPALAQSFVVSANDAVVTVIVNHLKSKGSTCDSDGDPNLGDGQGNCNLARTSAATAMADWLAGDPTSSGDDDFLIVGDLNAYVQEDPLTALKKTGLVNLLEAKTDPYSFVFDAKAGALDHAVASPSLAPQVVETLEWHINADEPALLDYNLENGRNPDLFDPSSPYRASDHDPIIVGLKLTN